MASHLFQVPLRSPYQDPWRERLYRASAESVTDNCFLTPRNLLEPQNSKLAPGPWTKFHFLSHNSRSLGQGQSFGHTVTSCSPLPLAQHKSKPTGTFHVIHQLWKTAKGVLAPFLLSPLSLLFPGRRTVGSLTLGNSSRKSVPELEKAGQKPPSCLPPSPWSLGIHSYCLAQ